MIQVENLSYSYPTKDLYHNISFSIKEDQHAVLIGSNGTGKTTLIHLLTTPEDFLYEGMIRTSINGRVGYVSQFTKRDKEKDITVFDFLAEDFVHVQAEMEAVCAEMATAEDLDPLMERYQEILDESMAMDADHYESNIHKELKTAGLTHLTDLTVSVISGGEYKLLQVIRQMLRRPSLLIMDEPDAFLDFSNLTGLRNLINHYQGTLLVVTHNRYLLNHCFDKILHLENSDIQEFDGIFAEYNLALLEKKIALQELSSQQQKEIDRSKKVVERMRAEATRTANATFGRALHAKVSYLERLEARKIKDPFVELCQPEIKLPTIQREEEAEEPRTILTVQDYCISYEDSLLEHVDFVLKENEKAAIVGANGTGKSTLLRDIMENQTASIRLAEDVQVEYLSQIHGETLSSDQEMLSGGEKTLQQLTKIGNTHANLLLLDEPTSHLDTYAQIALEKAIQEYQGAVLMVSHDFYTIVNCADYILYVEEKGIRKMRIRSFRKRIYEDHFKMEYLELEQKKKELEQRIHQHLAKHDFESAKDVCEELNTVIERMKSFIS